MHKPDPTADWPSSFPKFLHFLNSDQLATRGLVLLVAYALFRGLVGAATRPFWFDEVCTWIVARQPSLPGIWNALAHAADGQAPGFYVIERLSAALIRNEEIALRLPLILGFCCVIICVFVFTRRRAGPAYALLCAAIPLATLLFNWYAVEARPYSLVVACIALALVAYQRAPSAAWMIVMGLSLAASLTLSYYAAFAMIPLGLAELAVCLTRRQIRWRVWFAFAFGVVPLVVFWPLLSKLKQVYGEHYYAGANLSGLIHAYGSFFMTPPPIAAAIAAGALLGMMALIFSLARHYSGLPTNADDLLPEYVLVLALICLPPIGIVVAKLTHTGITDRYVLSGILGIPLAFGFVFPRLDRRSVILAAACLIALLVVQEASFWKAMQRIGFRRFESPAQSWERFVTLAGYPDLPVVVSDGLEYLPLAHYAALPWSDRMVCLFDPQNRLAFAGNDTQDKQLEALRSFASLRVYDFPDFASQHKVFLLYSAVDDVGDPHHMWTERLIHDGYVLRVLAVDRTRIIYFVTGPQDSR